MWAFVHYIKMDSVSFMISRIPHSAMLVDTLYVQTLMHLEKKSLQMQWLSFVLFDVCNHTDRYSNQDIGHQF